MTFQLWNNDYPLQHQHLPLSDILYRRPSAAFFSPQIIRNSFWVPQMENIHVLATTATGFYCVLSAWLWYVNHTLSVLLAGCRGMRSLSGLMILAEHEKRRLDLGATITNLRIIHYSYNSQTHVTYNDTDWIWEFSEYLVVGALDFLSHRLRCCHAEKVVSDWLSIDVLRALPPSMSTVENPVRLMRIDQHWPSDGRWTLDLNLISSDVCCT